MNVASFVTYRIFVVRVEIRLGLCGW